ncbi:MAG: 50S ribosomal protein L6 [Nanoarchaeota archaeon]
MAQNKPFEERIALPEGVTGRVEGGVVILKGKAGELKREIIGPRVAVEGAEIVLRTEKGLKKQKKLVMSAKAHIKNMCSGVMAKHVYILKICSGHFPMTVAVQKGEFVVKNLYGEKVARTVKVVPGTDVKVDGTAITVESVDKELAGKMAANIQQLTRRPGFDTRIFQDGIYITEKSGKKI